MLFDEPALDSELVGEVRGVIQELVRDGVTMVIVTHEMGFAAKRANRVVFMEQGNVGESDPPSQLFETSKSNRLKQFLEIWNEHAIRLLSRAA